MPCPCRKKKSQHHNPRDDHAMMSKHNTMTHSPTNTPQPAESICIREVNSKGGATLPVIFVVRPQAIMQSEDRVLMGVFNADA
jgi:hypothetical protein